MKTLSFILMLVLLGTGSAKAQTPFKVWFLHPDTILCGNLAIDLNGEIMPGMPLVEAHNGTPPYTTQWMPADGVSDPTSLTPVLSPTVSTTYTVAIQDANGLKDTVYYTVHKVNNYNGLLRADTWGAGCSGSTGSIFVHLNEGIPLAHAATYMWSNGGTSAYEDSLQPGIYNITVTDPFGCTGEVSDTVTSGVLDVQAAVYYQSCTTNLYSRVRSYGTTSLQYLWNGIAGSSNLINPASGNYTLVVTDLDGCTGTASVIVPASTPFKLDSVKMNAANCNDNTGSGCIYLSGGLLPYYYWWEDQYKFSPCFTGAGADTATYRIYDSRGCFIDTFFIIPYNSALNVQIVPDTALYNRPDSLTVNVSGGTQPYSYLWMPAGDTTPVLQVDSNTYYVVVRVIDAASCYAFDTIIVGGCDNTCRWPGDANYDGIADNTDLLYIGLGYNSTGPVDYYWNDLEWRAHPIMNWDSVTIDTVNFKHMDCNGDGTINADDTTAILLNYGLQHPRSGGDDEWRANTPPLQPIVLNDTVTHGDTLIVDLVLGDVLNPAEDIYGIAFTINYNPITVDTTKTQVLFGDSWLGNATDKISITKDFTDIGQIKCAITRIDHANRSGNGAIGTVKYVITTDNINGKDLLYFTNDIWISDITAMDRNGNRMDINAGRDSATIEYEITGINDVAWADKINIYPNPAQNILNISSPQVMVNTVAITNVLGERVIVINVNANNTTINTESLQPGIYFTELNTDKGTFTKRLVVTR